MVLSKEAQERGLHFDWRKVMREAAGVEEERKKVAQQVVECEK